ncbi:hypothetical protein PCANC_09940 [Puccinia coronata f. sp. avenae]|uniref:Gamma tubulin complex component protein N-terminal domain-containing protein n=1 Tax=Puccinia coronata f. sp. avenae TaxID=200324 RepID=A0A2N5V2U5_9BASI|nr:hypothetical protein PCANC_09940 [Puccinia coronata f. sp. avenae]
MSLTKLEKLSTQQQPSAAQKLKQYRQHYQVPAHLEEHLLLKDMIYLLQGIDGRYQAFTFALKEELGTYYRAIAIIESHLSNNTNNNNNNNNNNTGLMTSKALLLHLNPTVLRLRMSAALISATKGMHGGQMISVLHSYTDHGDPVVHLFTCNLLEKVSVPWFATLVSWMWDGLLVDPLDEFFIANARNLPNLSSSSSSSSSHHHQNNNHNPPDFDNGLPADAWNVWQTKFSFRKHMVPSFISEGFARKIFSTGKSLNFIRHSCGDYEWHQTRSRIYKASRKESLHYKDMAGLQQTISSTYGIATQPAVPHLLRQAVAAGSSESGERLSVVRKGRLCESIDLESGPESEQASAHAVSAQPDGDAGGRDPGHQSGPPAAAPSRRSHA